MRLKADGIIATHDLLLGTLADQFPEYIRNYCFEADIKDNELTFSYRLREHERLLPDAENGDYHQLMEMSEKDTETCTCL